MPVNMKGKSFLTPVDLSAGEIRYLPDLACDLKAKKPMGLAGDAPRAKKKSLAAAIRAVLVAAQ